MEEPNVPPSAELRFRVPLHTRWSDGDVQGVLNNAVYLTLFEEGRHAYFSHLDLMEGDESFPFLLLQTNVRFQSPGRGGEDVTLEMGTTHLGRSSLTQAYRIVDGQGVVWCEGEAVLVCHDVRGGSRPMSDRMRDAIHAFEV